MNVRKVKYLKMQNIYCCIVGSREKRIRLKQKRSQTGRKWNLEGVFGTTGERVKDAVVEYLNDTGVYYRIEIVVG